MERRMKMKPEAAAFGVAIEEAKKRCRAVEDRIESLSSSSSSCGRNLLSDSCKRTLLRLVHSELSFLSRLSLSSSSDDLSPNLCLSVNVGHLEAVIHILQQPFIAGVSRVCKPLPQSPSVETGKIEGGGSHRGVHVDVVCTVCGNPVWFIVSDRNPKYVSWHGSDRNKGLRARIEQVLDAARSSVSLTPSSVVLFFSNGLDDSVQEKLRNEFQATDFGMEFSSFDCGFTEEVEGEWINVLARSYRRACVLEINIVDYSGHVTPCLKSGIKDSLQDSARPDISGEYFDLNLGSSFCSLISGLKVGPFNVEDAELTQPSESSCKSNLINFDTTALIAIVSGISNGSAKKLLAAPESQLRSQFKSNFDFVIDQATSEIQSPIHVELGNVISGKRGMICKSVFSEFKKLVSMCGGPNEKLRADHLLKHFMIVRDKPSSRMLSLPTTRKLALKNKVVFGTGDYWHAPTLTANMAFVRAISQTGMPLFTVEHRPRALTGD